MGGLISDQDTEEGAGDGGLTAELLSALQELHVLDPPARVVLREAVVAPHLVLVDDLGLGLGQPVRHPLHLAVAAEGISVKIDLTVVVLAGVVTEHLVNLVPHQSLQIPDLVEADVQVSESLQAVQGEVDLRQLVVPETYIQPSHWSSSYLAALSLVQSFRVLKYFHALKGPIIGALSDATPAVLCHKEPARRKNKYPLIGVLLAHRWFFMS